MQLVMRDVIRLFQVSEKTVHDWIKNKKMPVFTVSGRRRFNSIELLEWALANGVRFGLESLDFGNGEKGPSYLSDAVKRGGIFYEVEGENREGVLSSVAKLLPLSSEDEQKTVLAILLAREKLESTALGKGIAIPHVRSPLVLEVAGPSITVCFLKRSVDFGAKEPVYVLFTLISPSIKLHLLLLSRLVTCLQDAGFLEFLRARAPKERLIADLMVLESKILSKGQTPA